MKWLNLALLMIAVLLLVYLVVKTDRIESATKPRLHLLASASPH